MMSIIEITFSGFVSKVVNDIVDISKDKIRNAIKNTKHQNMETQIYKIIVDVLNKITNNLFADDLERIYDAAEVLLKSFKETEGDGIKNIKDCLQSLNSDIGKIECLKFKVLLYEELGREIYSELYRAILLLLLEQKNKYEYDINEQLLKKLTEVEQNLDNLNRKLNKINSDNHGIFIHDGVEKFKNDKKDKYVGDWYDRLFLHIDNDENPITLEDVFIMPDYRMIKSIDRIGFSCEDTLDSAIEKFMYYEKSSTMLITGVPGIGKSTITSWIANEYRDDNRIIILRFRDWSYEELENGLLYAICSKLNCKYEDLEKIILVIDGFDEIKALDISDKLIGDFFVDIKDYDYFKCIITSRPAYINLIHFHNVCELKEFDFNRMEQFYRALTGKNLAKRGNVESIMAVLGIPVILYMAIISNVDISEEYTKPELYSKIFAEEGGIFDKFYDGVTEYSSGSQILRIPENINKYLNFLRETAFRMFEKSDLTLLKKEYQIPKLPYRGNFVSVLEFPIKHLFESSEFIIEFVHKSIYEYFVSDYIFAFMHQMIDVSNEELAGAFGRMLKGNILSCEILSFLQYKIKKEMDDRFHTVYETFQIMIRDGMTYYAKECNKNVIKCEKNVFANMLEILHMWEMEEYLELDNSVLIYMTNGVNLKKINFNCQRLNGINAGKLDLSAAQLCKTVISNSVLIDANFCDAYMERAKITHTNLRNAIFKRAVLRGAELRKVDLAETDLSDADFREVVLDDFSLYGANLNNSIWHIDDIRKIYAQLHKAKFTYIIVTSTYNQKAVSREHYLSKRNVDDFITWLCDELGI